MSVKAIEIIPKPPLTPFRRRSRILCTSEDNLIQTEVEEEEEEAHYEQETIHTICSSAVTGTLKISVPSATFGEIICRNSPTVSSIARIPEVADGISSSPPNKTAPSDEEVATNSCSEESSSSPISSPPCSWRGSDRSSSSSSWRGSPSQRSQDSGYSDSGESTSGSPNNPSSTNEPHVKHITRVYFGDYKRSESGVNESTQTPPNYVTPRTYRVGKRRVQSTTNNSSVTFKNQTLSKSEPRLCSSDNSSSSTSSSSSSSSCCKQPTSPTTNSSNKDEFECQLEHKSLSNVSLSCTKNSPTSESKESSQTSHFNSSSCDLNQSSQSCASSSSSSGGNGSACERKIGKYTSRLYRKLSSAKKFAKRTTSSEKLDVLIKTKRKDPIKARRRWSAADVEKSTILLDFSVKDRLSSTTIHEDREYFSPLDQSPKSPFEISEYLGNDSLYHWLGDLECMTDSECMNTLQSKSLFSEPPSPVAASTQARLKDIQKRAHLVSAEFALLCQRLENLQLDQVPNLVDILVTSVTVFIHSNKERKTGKRSLQCQIKVVEQICKSLTEICWTSIVNVTSKSTEDLTRRTSSDTNKKSKYSKIDKEKIRELVKIVTALGHAFTKLVDILLCDGINTLVHILEDEIDEREVESAVSEVTALGVYGGHICKLVSRVGGIRALLGVCLESRFRRLRATTLRALATVCCVGEGIDTFEKEGGVSVIAEVLCDPECPEDERAEAAGVLAQITSPWVEDSHSLPGLKLHLKSLVSSLTELASSTTSAEVFLLTSAALANLTLLDVSCIKALLESSTDSMLLKVVNTDDNLSVFTKDQIATIFANMSSSPEASQRLLESGGVDVLLKLLHITPKETHRLPEVAAIERVQQKSAIALSRLSTIPKAANLILRKGGATRLAHLCRNEKERNHSDAVLVACLAALRKIATSCDNEELRHANVSELIEPKLLDSFFIYSSQNESFV